MCVWQSHAPGGTSKLTGVAGWEALASPVRVRSMIPAAIVPSRTSRRVGIVFLLSCLDYIRAIEKTLAGVLIVCTGCKLPELSMMNTDTELERLLGTYIAFPSLSI